jgi:hypothetical protein
MPPLSGEHPAGGGEQDPVACGELGTAGLAAQHPKLLPEYEDLQVLGTVIVVEEDEQTGEEADGQPEHEEHRGMVRNACSRCESGFPRPTAANTQAPTRDELTDLAEQVRVAVAQGPTPARKRLLHALIHEVQVHGRDMIIPVFRVPGGQPPAPSAGVRTMGGSVRRQGLEPRTR